MIIPQSALHGRAANVCKTDYFTYRYRHKIGLLCQIFCENGWFSILKSRTDLQNAKSRDARRFTQSTSGTPFGKGYQYLRRGYRRTPEQYASRPALSDNATATVHAAHGDFIRNCASVRVYMDIGLRVRNRSAVAFIVRHTP